MHSQLKGFQANPFSHTPLSINSLHSHVHSSSFQRSLLLQTLCSNLHLHLHDRCHSMRLFSLIPATRLNILTFKYYTTSGTHNFASGLLTLLHLPLPLLVLTLKGKNTGSSPLKLTICGLALHFWLFIKIQLNEFMPVQVDKNTSPVRKHLLINPRILLHYVIFFIK